MILQNLSIFFSLFITGSPGAIHLSQAKGWYLEEATGINNNGDIIGYGSLNGDIKQRPWILTPVYRRFFPWQKPEYLLPHFVWPDGWERPDDWPEGLPFPLPHPSPFTLVGKGAAPLKNLEFYASLRESAKAINN